MRISDEPNNFSALSAKFCLAAADEFDKDFELNKGKQLHMESLIIMS